MLMWMIYYWMDVGTPNPKPSSKWFGNKTIRWRGGRLPDDYEDAMDTSDSPCLYMTYEYTPKNGVYRNVTGFMITLYCFLLVLGVAPPKDSFQQ